MRLSLQVIHINKIAKEILLAQSFLVLAGKKITFYSIAKRINEVRTQNGDFTTIRDEVVKDYLKNNLKIKEI